MLKVDFPPGEDDGHHQRHSRLTRHSPIMEQRTTRAIRRRSRTETYRQFPIGTPPGRGLEFLVPPGMSHQSRPELSTTRVPRGPRHRRVTASRELKLLP